MAKIYQGTIDLIGNTPLVELTHIEKKYELGARLLAKVEYFNPAGSVKDRIAKEMIEQAEKLYKRGDIETAFYYFFIYCDEKSDNTDGFTLLGDWYMELGDTEKADEMLSPFEGKTTGDYDNMIKLLYDMYIESGCTCQEAIANIASTEPYVYAPEKVAMFCDKEGINYEQ